MMACDHHTSKNRVSELPNHFSKWMHGDHHHLWDSQKLLAEGSEECQQQEVPPEIKIIVAIIVSSSNHYHHQRCRLKSSSKSSSSPSSSCWYLPNVYIWSSFSSLSIIISDTRRVQTDKSQSRDGNPRTWYINIIDSYTLYIFLIVISCIDHHLIFVGYEDNSLAPLEAILYCD